jgi:hypothetical protein
MGRTWRCQFDQRDNGVLCRRRRRRTGPALPGGNGGAEGVRRAADRAHSGQANTGGGGAAARRRSQHPGASRRGYPDRDLPVTVHVHRISRARFRCRKQRRTVTHSPGTAPVPRPYFQNVRRHTLICHERRLMGVRCRRRGGGGRQPKFSERRRRRRAARLGYVCRANPATERCRRCGRSGDRNANRLATVAATAVVWRAAEALGRAAAAARLQDERKRGRRGRTRVPAEVRKHVRHRTGRSSEHADKDTAAVRPYYDPKRAPERESRRRRGDGGNRTL